MNPAQLEHRLGENQSLPNIRQNEPSRALLSPPSPLLIIPHPHLPHAPLPPPTPKFHPRPPALIPITECSPVHPHAPLSLHDPVDLERVARAAMLRRGQGVLIEREGEDGSEEWEGGACVEGEEGECDWGVVLCDFWLSAWSQAQ